MRRAGYVIAFALIVVYGLVALRGPQGVSALLDKRQEVRQLEEQNSVLQDKLDMIYAILAPDYEEDVDPDEPRDNLFQIDGFSPKKKPE